MPPSNMDCPNGVNDIISYTTSDTIESIWIIDIPKSITGKHTPIVAPVDFNRNANSIYIDNIVIAIIKLKKSFNTSSLTISEVIPSPKPKIIVIPMTVIEKYKV